MASRYYCSNVASELEVFSRRLHKLSSEFQSVPSIDKYKLQPQIDELHIIMTELDDRLCDLVNSCSSTEELDSVGSQSGPGVKHHVSSRSNEVFDYDFGG